MIRVAINGFGRIGRNFLRTVLEDAEALKKIEVVAINIGPAPKEHLGLMFKYDTLMGSYPGTVTFKDDTLHIDNHAITILAHADAAQLPWKKLAIDWVVDCSGHYTKREAAQQHLTAGAKAVLISAPATDEDVSIVPGVNDNAFDASQHKIVSLGSCTTNALVTMLAVIHKEFFIERALMTTVHAYTNTQKLLDVEDKDPRRARAAALNIIPTSTGAQKVVSKIMPELTGLIEARALRVPVAIVSLIDLTVVTKKPVTVDVINRAYEQARHGFLKNILAITYEPLVSSDFAGDPHSAVIDAQLTTVSGSNMAKIFGWYDNEWGYSCRLKDFLVRNS